MTAKKSDVFKSIGRRKSSVARVKLSNGKGVYTINNRDIDDYVYTLVDENTSCSACDVGCYKLISEPKNIDSEFNAAA